MLEKGKWRSFHKWIEGEKVDLFINEKRIKKERFLSVGGSELLFQCLYLMRERKFLWVVSMS